MDTALRQLERAWQASPYDDGALERLLAELRRTGLDPVERLAALSQAPWAYVLRASLPVLRRDAPGGAPVLGRRLWVVVPDGPVFALAPVDVFADGLIDCRGVVDRARLARRLSGQDHPPILTEVPYCHDLYIHSLARGYVFAAAEWWTRRDDVARAADLVVRALGAASPGVKPTSVRPHPYRRAAGGELIEGRALPLLARDGGIVDLVWWVIYADGTSQLAPDRGARRARCARRSGPRHAPERG